MTPSSGIYLENLSKLANLKTQRSSSRVILPLWRNVKSHLSDLQAIVDKLWIPMETQNFQVAARVLPDGKGTLSTSASNTKNSTLSSGHIIISRVRRML